MNKNHQKIWKKFLPLKACENHKYHYGHALIYGARDLTGATNLAASACARIGTGLVTVISDHKADVYRSILPPHILVRNDAGWQSKTVTAKLYGPGGVSIIPDYSSDTLTILDAEAILEAPATLQPNFILTPHEGEFQKAFPDISGDKLDKAKKAAKQKGCYIVLKGQQTIIADPDGRYVINEADAPWLATAGTGDVLAGMITGLIAQKMPIFEACCAAVWIHEKTAREFGSYLIASDLLDQLPKVLKKL